MNTTKDLQELRTRMVGERHGRGRSGILQIGLCGTDASAPRCRFAVTGVVAGLGAGRERAYLSVSLHGPGWMLELLDCEDPDGALNGGDDAARLTRGVRSVPPPLCRLRQECKRGALLR
ncbi:hypothetical protein GCM10029992_37730 [Glycomyces albus]